MSPRISTYALTMDSPLFYAYSTSLHFCRITWLHGRDAPMSSSEDETGVKLIICDPNISHQVWHVRHPCSRSRTDVDIKLWVTHSNWKSNFYFIICQCCLGSWRGSRTISSESGLMLSTSVPSHPCSGSWRNVRRSVASAKLSIRTHSVFSV